MKNSLFVLSSVSLCILGMAAPQTVHAQNSDNELIRNTPVTLNTENAPLYSALKSVFDQAKADFTITASLKNLPITAHLNQPFRIALESVLKATGQPLTYTINDGVYHIMVAALDQGPIASEPPEETTLPPKRKPVMREFRVRNGSGLEIAAMLGATFVPWTVSLYPPYIGSNPFAPVRVGGGGFGGGGQGNNNSSGLGGGASGFTNGFTGSYILPGLGAGFFGNALNQGSNGSGNGNGGG